ncbi:uncharacterized protein LOC112085231 [Eutrema salsugineum]|uniref:uncharacterized protein LOC112085231 n=1 Tax=Eutrema salsugineum TaxID=72664 RepID=UPI000CED194F|nr:uncharacterized protein LOC112085231 [Eutrema salsugineum]
MWVVLRNVPSSMFSWKGLSFFTSPLGEPKKLHQDTLWATNFEEAKVFVDVNLHRKLPESFDFKSSTGLDTVVYYEFPWMPPRYTSCAKWGHCAADCKAVPGDKIILSRQTKSPATSPQSDIRRDKEAPVEVPISMEIDVRSRKQATSALSKEKDLKGDGGSKKHTDTPTSSVKRGGEGGLIEREVNVGELEGSGSRFASLLNEETDHDEGKEENRDIENDKDEAEESVDNEQQTQGEIQEQSANLVASGRVPLPRGSKLTHKFVKPPLNPNPTQATGKRNKGRPTKSNQDCDFLFGGILETRVVESKADGIVAKTYPCFKDKSDDYGFSEIARSGGILCSFVYGSNFLEERKNLWRNLRDLATSPIYWRMKWMIMGDFNEILSREEHSGADSGSIIASGMEDFQAAVRDCDLSDMGSHGPLLTWCNKRSEGLICKKLDRLLAVVQTTCVFKDALRKYWDSTNPLFHSTSATFRFSKKLKMLKPIARAVSRDLLSDISRRRHQQEESKAFDRWERNVSLEERFLAQKAKLHWLKVGDRNNKIFHRAIKCRVARNGVRELAQDGVLITERNEIKEAAVNHFQGFLNFAPDDISETNVHDIQELLGFQCSEENLLKEVTAEEVKGVLFAMASNKSPGPDGYTVEFFKESWEIIGGDFVVGMQSFFIKGFLPKGVNSTILALIPKLKQLLPRFIASNQSAFVQDRLLIENLLLASELVARYHKSIISSRCALKIDVSKAFDTVNWDFLIRTLEALNLPPAVIHWIDLCISTASFSVQVNGELCGYFGSSRGPRQGCSLSPYLFVICMNVLSKMLDKAAIEQKFGFHPKCSNISLTHLCFADDLMVFSDGTLRSIQGIFGVFDDFSKRCGLRISVEKSTIFIAGVTDSVRESISQNFPFEFGSLPVRYLGLPLLTKQMRSLDYMPLIDRIKGNFNSWNARALSFGGRLQLLSSVVASTLNFWLSAFRLPAGCIAEIERICSAFLWSGPDLNLRKAEIAWKSVCKPREEGGLGLKSIHEANEVSLLKLVWRLVMADSLWVRWIRHNLMRHGSIWTTPEPTSNSPGSWMWKKILQMRERAAEFFRVELGMGQILKLLGARGIVDMGIREEATVSEVLSSHRRQRHRVQSLNTIEDAI